MIFPLTPQLGVWHAERCHTDRLPEESCGDLPRRMSAACRRRAHLATLGSTSARESWAAGFLKPPVIAGRDRARAATV